MRILMLSSSSGSRGGGELYLYYLGRALAARGNEVILWASRSERMDALCEKFSEFGKIHRSDYSNTYDSPLRSLKHLPSLVRPRGSILRDIRKLAPDAVLVNKQNNEDGLDLLAAAQAWGGSQACFVHITHYADKLGQRFGKARDWMGQQFLKRYGFPIVTHSNCVDELRSFAGGSSCVISINNGVNIPDMEALASLRQRSRAALDLADDTLYLLSVGRLEQQKRPDRFIHLLEQLKRRRQGNWQACWVGAGQLNETMQTMAMERGLAEYITWAGWQDDVKHFLAAADIYLHPAGFEGMPYSLLEAGAHALPCLIMEELAQDLNYFDEDCAIIASEGSDAWLDTAFNDDKRKQLGNNIRQLVSQKYSIDRMAADYEALFKRTGAPA